MVAGLAVGVLVVRRQQTLAGPLLDLRLFRSRTFNAALATNVLDFFVEFGALLFIAQYLQLVLGCRRCRRACGCCPPPSGSSWGPC